MKHDGFFCFPPLRPLRVSIMLLYCASDGQMDAMGHTSRV